jgi:type I restriction enzyme S subunit
MSGHKFGLSPAQWSILQKNLIRPLKDHQCHVWVFGSRATGNHRPFSDIDILYQPSSTLPEHLIGAIEENMELSALPIKVDLVSNEDLAESYRDTVEKQKIEI